MELNELKQELQAFKDSMPEFATSEDLNKKADELQKRVDSIGTDDLKKSLDEIRTAVDEQGLELKKLNERPDEFKGIGGHLADKAEALKEMSRNGGQGLVSFSINKADVTRASVTDHTLAMRLTDVGQLAFKTPKLEPLFASGTVGANSNGVIRYVDQTAITNSSAWTAEGAQKPESAITWQEYTLPIQKIAHTIPVTMEALNDVAFMESEINNMLLTRLNDKIDTDLYGGTGVAPIIFGIKTRADAYTPVASGLTDANIYDLIVKVGEDITDASQYQPNVALVSHATFSQMILKKDGNNNYVMPPFASIITPNGGIEQGLMVNGVKVIPSASVGAGEMVLGDFRYATVYSLGGTTIDVGMIDKQFIENMVTIRAERRIGMLVREAHTDAFRLVSDIDAALTTLATAPA